ncbi:hypothetical protein CLV51_103340 [Chitinophaga niastensis]|uniref:Uncharacterized protein n=1 Tax=Chitinophaga niastensis TaxID=536980 RepID=A0A2P8HJG7_CHINA|nr:hypothetical protein [Chitinophaga niastensis]PSL46362.1 hypothetical protein CLV51_103340 [Chitinophaga niastensis]
MKLISIGNVCAITALAFFCACTRQMKEELNTPKEKTLAAAVSAAGPSKDGILLRELLNSQGPVFENFIIDATQGGEFSTQDGSNYALSPNSLQNPDGTITTGPVNISVKEIHTVSNMIMADKQTNTSNAEPLVSYGEFFVRATQGAQDVSLRKDSAIQVKVKAGQVNVKEVPMWNGDSAVAASFTGTGYINQPVTVTQLVSANKGVDWTQSGAFALFNSTTGTLNFRLDSLIKWVNCDRLGSNPNPKTTVLGYFTNFYNTATNTSYTGEEPSMLFFKPKAQNTLIKFYNTIFTPPAGFAGFLSYQNSIPIGMQGTFLAITSLNGAFYAEQKTVTIAAPLPGQNYTTVSFNLQPVSGPALVALIVSMNSK